MLARRQQETRSIRGYFCFGDQRSKRCHCERRVRHDRAIEGSRSTERKKAGSRLTGGFASLEETFMDARYTYPGYAYTPVLGEKSVYIADVQIDGKPHRFKLRAND